MAVRITAAEQAAAVDAATADLKFLLSKEGVSVLNQAKVYHVGIINIQLFSTFVSDEKDLREFLKTNLELDPATDVASRVQVAAFSCAWLPKSDYLATRVSWKQGSKGSRTGWSLAGTIWNVSWKMLNQVNGGLNHFRKQPQKRKWSQMS